MSTRDYAEAAQLAQTFTLQRRPSQWTEEESRAYGGLLHGVEQEATYWDAVDREACVPCEVCEQVFHSRDLEPCGPCENVCPACAEEYDR